MRTGYKGDYGKALIVAGSTGYTGANKIASEACIKNWEPVLLPYPHINQS